MSLSTIMGIDPGLRYTGWGIIQKNNKIKLVPTMLNLLGCNKENFKKLINSMGYKITISNEEVFFKYSPIKNMKKDLRKKISKENPFNILKDLKLG